MPTPSFIVALREHIGHDLLWLNAATAVVLRPGADGDEVLLVRRSDNGRWTTIGGILEPGEEAAACAVRETKEETGLDVEIERLTWVYTSEVITYDNGDHAQYMEIVFRCRWLAGEPYPADDESTEARWFPLTALPELAEVQRARIASAYAETPWLTNTEGMRRAGLR